MISSSSLSEVDAGREVWSYFNDRCSSSGGSGSGKCTWKDVEVLHYTAGCTGGEGYTSLVILVALKANQGVTILAPGGNIGFW